MANTSRHDATNFRMLVFVTLLVSLGSGCWSPPSYVKAPPSAPINIPPNAEGAKASTGGAEATITPPIATQLLVNALPVSSGGWEAAEAVESKLPLPLPDGTRTEATKVEREYRRSGNALMSVRVSMTDTRGIPALLLFMNAFEAYESAESFRKELSFPDAATWLTYTRGPNGETDGTGSVTQVFRKRFLIQIDGSAGASVADLERFIGAVNRDALR